MKLNKSTSEIKKYLFTASRLMFIIPLGLFGIMHFVIPDFFTLMVPSYLEYRYFWVYLSGVVLFVTSLLISFRIIPYWASLGLMLFIIIFIVSVDIPGIIYPGNRIYRVVSLLKDLSLLGGTFLYFLIFRIRNTLI